MHSVCPCSLPVWRRSLLKKGTPWPIFGPALDLPLGGSGRKTTTLVRDHEYFIPTKIHQNLSSGSEEEVEIVKVYRRTTTDDGRTDDGRCAMTIAHLSLWLRWAKKLPRFNQEVFAFFNTCKKKYIHVHILLQIHFYNRQYGIINMYVI